MTLERWLRRQRRLPLGGATATSLATVLEIPRPRLYAYMEGTTSIPQELADKIEVITGGLVKPSDFTNIRSES